MAKRSQARTVRGLLKSKRPVTVEALLKAENSTTLLSDMIHDLEHDRKPADGFIVIGVYEGYARIATTLSPDSTLAHLVRAQAYCMDMEADLYSGDPDDSEFCD